MRSRSKCDREANASNRHSSNADTWSLAGPPNEKSFMTSSIAALLERWLGRPVRVSKRPAPQKFGYENTRQLSLFR